MILDDGILYYDLANGRWWSYCSCSREVPSIPWRNPRYLWGDDYWCPSSLPNVEEGYPQGSRHQCQRFSHQIKIRQSLYSPSIHN
jgi:hypothetical protein